MMKNKKLSFWLAWKSLYNDKEGFDLSTQISLIGLIIGVSCLVVSMAVVSGFFSALQKSVVDITGDVFVFSRSTQMDPWPQLVNKIKKIDDRVVAGTPFFLAEGLIAHKGKTAGVAVQGLDTPSAEKVLNLKHRIIRGRFGLSPSSPSSSTIPALVGKNIMENMRLKVGDSFRIVFPIANVNSPHQFKRRVGTFRVNGVLSLGKYDYDSRSILAPLSEVQKITGVRVGRDYTGLYLKLKSLDTSISVSEKINSGLPSFYWSRPWQSVEQSLFEAIELEKIGIFLVIFIIILAAAINVASSLYIRVIRKYSEIAILKSMGFPPKEILHLFVWQGTLIGVIGSFLGILLGIGLCFLFEIFITRTDLLPQDVYRLGQFSPVIQPLDLLIIFASATFICFLSTLAPARRGAKLQPIEGLRYE